MNDIVTLSTDDLGIATVTLNRPEKKNAWALDTFRMLGEIGDGLKSQDGLRAVILTGADGCFSSGIDLAVFGEFSRRMEDIRAQMRNPPPGEVANHFQKPVTVWSELSVPVIAAIQGVCFGAGMQLALGADFRLAASDTKFSIMESRWGLIPDMGITRSLPKLLRADQAKELMMTGRIFSGPEAHEMGLVTRLTDDPLAAAQEMAKGLVGQSPDVLSGAKALVDQAWLMDAPQSLSLEALLQSEILGSPNQAEAVAASLQKRPGKY